MLIDYIYILLVHQTPPNGFIKPSQIPSLSYCIYLRQNLNLVRFVDSLNLSPGVHKVIHYHSVRHTSINALSLWSLTEVL